MIVEHRASIILFNVLSGLKDKRKPFLLPANVCPIVVLTYLKAGVAFELIDIAPDSLCLNEEIALGKLSTNINVYGGIHYVHTFGVENNPSDFFSSVKSLNADFFVIDDKCLNIPEFRTNPLQNNIDLELFSTGYSKYVDIGWGGFGYLQPKYLYQPIRIPYELKDLERLTESIIKNIDDDTIFRYSDSNWLGDTLFSTSPEKYQQQVMSKMAIVSAHKDVINSFYSHKLPREVQFPIAYQNWRFNIKVPKRNELLEKIFEVGLFASTHYPSVTHLFNQIKASNAEEYNINILNLFNDFRFDLDKAKKITSLINEHLIQ